MLSKGGGIYLLLNSKLQARCQTLQQSKRQGISVRHLLNEDKFLQSACKSSACNIKYKRLILASWFLALDSILQTYNK